MTPFLLQIISLGGLSTEKTNYIECKIILLQIVSEKMLIPKSLEISKRIEFPIIEYFDRYGLFGEQFQCGQAPLHQSPLPFIFHLAIQATKG